MTWASEQINRLFDIVKDQGKRITRLETQAGYYETFVDEISELVISHPGLAELVSGLKNQLDTIDEESG